MISEFFLNIVFGFVNLFFEAMPDITWDVNTTVWQYAKDILDMVAYLLPWQTVCDIIKFFWGIIIFRVLVSFVKTLWDVLPFV